MNKTKLAGALILAFLVAPSITLAQTQSVASLQAELQQLLAQVSALETRITTQGSSTTPWCYTFNSNLSIGMSGASVTGLQTALQRDGDSVQVTGTFDDQTASAITSFQEKYSPQILAPYDLSYGTGYVGTTTRAELNSLFGCAAVMNSVPTPTPITSGDINNIPTATLSANPSNITAGQPTTLAWSSTRATTCTINGTDGYNDNGPWSQSNLASSGVESVIPYSSLSKPYTAKYSITCAGSSGTSNPASAAVTVSASTTAQSPTGSVSLVSISSPNGRETLTWGSNNRITWSGGTTKVQVGLVSANFNPSNPSVLGWISLNGSPNSSIFWNAANITDLTGSVNFPVTAGSYKIIVVSQSDDGGYCLNGGCNVSVSAAPFTIVGQSQATGASIQSFAASQVSTDSAIYDVAWVVSGSSAGQVSLTTACALGLTISEGAPGHMQPFKCGDVNDPVAYGEGDEDFQFINTSNQSINETIELSVVGVNAKVIAITVPPTSQPSFSVSQTNVNSGASMSFFWNVPTDSIYSQPMFTVNPCPAGITMYDATNGKSFLCGDLGRTVAWSGSDTIQFTNSATSSIQMYGQLDFGPATPLQQTFTVRTTTIDSTN